MAIESKKLLLDLVSEDEFDLKSQEFANYLDLHDPLRDLRKEFNIPLARDCPTVDPDMLECQDQEILYFNGNSLGLMPKISQVIFNYSTTKSFTIVLILGKRRLWGDRWTVGQNMVPLVIPMVSLHGPSATSKF